MHFSDTKMSSALDRKQIDDKIWQIEKHFRSRELNRASGSADLHTWELEERVAAVLGWLCLSVLLKTVKKSPPCPKTMHCHVVIMQVGDQ